MVKEKQKVEVVKRTDVFVGKGKKFKTVKQITAIEKNTIVTEDVLYCKMRVLIYFF